MPTQPLKPGAAAVDKGGCGAKGRGVPESQLPAWLSSPSSAAQHGPGSLLRCGCCARCLGQAVVQAAAQCPCLSRPGSLRMPARSSGVLSMLLHSTAHNTRTPTVQVPMHCCSISSRLTQTSRRGQADHTSRNSRASSSRPAGMLSGTCASCLPAWYCRGTGSCRSRHCQQLGVWHTVGVHDLQMM